MQPSSGFTFDCSIRGETGVIVLVHKYNRIIPCRKFGEVKNTPLDALKKQCRLHSIQARIAIVISWVRIWRSSPQLAESSSEPGPLLLPERSGLPKRSDLWEEGYNAIEVNRLRPAARRKLAARSGSQAIPYDWRVNCQWQGRSGSNVLW